METLDLFNTRTRSQRRQLGQRAVVLRGFALPYVRELMPAIADIEEVSPFRHMVTRGGFTMSVALIERLTSLRGVGQWTVEMFLIYSLERSDILPMGDFGVREGYRRLKGLMNAPTPRQMREIGEAWRPGICGDFPADEIHSQESEFLRMKSRLYWRCD